MASGRLLKKQLFFQYRPLSAARLEVKKLRITDPARSRVLASPLRIELLELLIRQGPSTVAELAAALGRAPDSLYYHLRKLERLGFLTVVRRRVAGRRPEAVFEAVADQIEVECDPTSEAAIRIEEQSLGALLRLTERNYSRALRSGEAHPRGRARDLLATRIRVNLDAAGRAELNRRIDELLDFLREASEPEHGPALGLTLVLSPITR